MAKLSDTQLAHLTPAQMKEVRPDQFSVLSQHQVAQFSRAQFSECTPQQRATFSTLVGNAVARENGANRTEQSRPEATKDMRLRDALRKDLPGDRKGDHPPGGTEKSHTPPAGHRENGGGRPAPTSADKPPTVRNIGDPPSVKGKDVVGKPPAGVEHGPATGKSGAADNPSDAKLAAGPAQTPEKTADSRTGTDGKRGDQVPANQRRPGEDGAAKMAAVKPTETKTNTDRTSATADV